MISNLFVCLIGHQPFVLLSFYYRSVYWYRIASGITVLFGLLQ
jgi:hypothetical protein